MAVLFIIPAYRYSTDRHCVLIGKGKESGCSFEDLISYETIPVGLAE